MHHHIRTTMVIISEGESVRPQQPCAILSHPDLLPNIVSGFQTQGKHVYVYILLLFQLIRLSTTIHYLLWLLLLNCITSHISVFSFSILSLMYCSEFSFMKFLIEIMLFLCEHFFFHLSIAKL